MSDQSVPGFEGMRREQFTLEVTNVDWIDEDGEPNLPTLTAVFDGDAAALREGVFGTDGDAANVDKTDVTVRLHGSPDERDASGVVAVTDRITGEYLVEVNVAVDDLLSFITAARRYGERTDDTARYRVSVATGAGDPIVVHEKRTLLVYSEEGELLRGHSLIPSGVEI